MRRLFWLLIIALIAVPGVRFTHSPHARPAGPPPEPVAPSAEPLPSPGEMELLARTDPLGFLRACVRRYQREVRGYTTVLVKQEFLGGKLGPVEIVDAAFREDPFSVLMKWRTPPVGRADRVLYVQGANDGKTLARPAGRAARFLVGGIVARDSDGPDARAAGRYTLPEFGLLKGTERTLAAWSSAERRGGLKVEYRGVRRVPEAGNAECYMLRRTCDPPEEDGIVTVEVAFDTMHWLQVANVLTAEDGRRVGAYYFRDLVLNPTFQSGYFDKAALLAE